MGQTITEKIFSEHAGKEVYAGEIVRVPIDMTIGNDITTPISIKAFEESGAERLANPDGFAIVMDHYIPAKDIASANQAKISREFAYKHDLKYFFDEKDMGIEHALLPEKGLVIPGDVIIGADSHTCTHGALCLLYGNGEYGYLFLHHHRRQLVQSTRVDQGESGRQTGRTYLWKRYHP